jgi:PAS domain S-box-containing protein
MMYESSHFNNEIGSAFGGANALAFQQFPGADVSLNTGLATQATLNPAFHPQPDAVNTPATPQSSLPGGSTLTEFTKRKNWPAKVVEELQDLLLMLNADGRIAFVSPSVKALTGYDAQELHNRQLASLIHPDDTGMFMSEFHEAIAKGHSMRVYYRFRKQDGEYQVFDTVGHAHIAEAKFAPNPNNKSPFCQAVFMMSRPYPTRNAHLLDSFLEHKMENLRLKRRITELRKEEAVDAEETARLQQQSHGGRSEVTASEDTMRTSSTNATVPYPGGNNGGGGGGHRVMQEQIPALTRENLESIGGSTPASLKEKIARFDVPSHAIEMFTGLRPQDGERSQGIMTGAGSPVLRTGDAGIAISADRDVRSGDRKKKVKVTEEYVCTDCGMYPGPVRHNKFSLFQARSTLQNGAKVPKGRRLCAMRAV